MNMIKLESSDGSILELTKNAACKSRTIKEMLEHCGGDEDLDGTTIPITKVEANILDKIKQYCEYHAENDENEKVKKEERDLWDKALLDIEMPILSDIISGANFLDIDDLLRAACKIVVSRIRGKTPNEIRKLLKIENDLSKEDIEAIRKENEWIHPKN